MYGFGAEELNEPSGQEAKEPAWFRARMDKVSEQVKALQERNAQLEKAQRQQEVAKSLTAKGYAPQVADLYTGEPNKLDDWLGTYGAGLAKADGTAVEAGQGVQGTPQTVVSTESQAALQQMASAGQDGVAALSGDDALTARLSAAQTPEEFAAVMRDAGNRRF